jgi:dipeptidyl aminopeptidase/acylaminoacyl peptidase
MYSVELDTGKAEMIAPHVSNITEQPLFWTQDGGLLVRTATNSISKFSHDRNGWHEVSRIELPDGWSYRGASLAGDDTHIIGDFQSPETAPEIFAYLPKEKDVLVLARLNPQFDGLTLAPAESIHWKSSEGLQVDGMLFTPPAYVKTKRYPLLIQTHPYTGGFVCDSGQDHFPSYIPQLAANAGIMYLMQTYPENWNEADWEAHYPRGYPGEKGYGGLQEAASSMDVWDSAVKSLDDLGLIDPTRVGIEGFSRKGWYVEFILAHAKTHYRAATATDNVQYSVGEYWLRHSAAQMKAYDLLYGGPPYGSTLKNWLDYSVSFNLDRFHTPLLMERMGYGETSYSNYASLSLPESYEVFEGLTRMRKPVEFYYYPDGKHQPDHPRARLATLQRNLDWYRFWLQGYERPDEADQSQYERWHHLRDLQLVDYPQDRLDSNLATKPVSADK